MTVAFTVRAELGERELQLPCAFEFVPGDGVVETLVRSVASDGRKHWRLQRSFVLALIRWTWSSFPLVLLSLLSARLEGVKGNALSLLYTETTVMRACRHLLAPHVSGEGPKHLQIAVSEV
ncbi:hypothetical protein HJG60_009239 [Phyllostomus discolor]|uniref:Uncharacterized protein n=1 Tax=Phyllostomus discolor TaxID=89673 RepID=A0A833YK40_9CHIR|nr:hypothetical protein HJG60_009239 [Phyllostomus discolor]